MRRTSNLILVVGIFSVIAVMLLFYLSLRVSGPSAKNTYPLYMEVDDAMGLEAGAEVVRAGVRIGIVEKLGLEGEKNKVRISLRIFNSAEVRQDSVASLRLKSLLGTYMVHLSHGSLHSPPAAAGYVLASESMVDINKVVKALAGVGEGAGDLIGRVDQNQQQFFDSINGAIAKVNGVIDENRGNVKTLTDALAGQAPKVESFFKTLSSVQEAIQGEHSSIGKLIYSDELHERVKGAAANLEEISAQVREGKGALGKMVFDETMEKQVSEIFTNVNGAATNFSKFLTENQDDVTKIIQLVKDMVPKLDSALDSFKSAGQNFAEISEKVNKGDGTLAKLVNENALYEDLRATVAQVRKTFEEGEEQSVLRTFLGVFFGSML